MNMMRPFGLGLAVALLIGALVGASAASAAPKDKDKDTSAVDAPPLVQQSGVPCTIAATRTIDKGLLSDGATATFYEVACQEGMGYVLIARNKAPLVQTEDCLIASQPAVDGKPNKLACKLPANLNPSASLAPAIAKTGRDCTIDKARPIGQSPTHFIYEVSCQGGAGYILQIPHLGAGDPAANPCIGYDEASTAVKCTLTTPDQRNATFNTLLASGGKPCTLKAKHFVGTTPTHSDYIEVACNEGKGYVLEIDKAGKLKAEIDCAQAGGIAGGCTLTDSRAAQTEQNGVYTRLAKKAGFNCDVAKYAAFAVDKPGLDVVELQCANRPDGGVGLFPATGDAHVLDCIRSQTEGYRCSYTPDTAVYPALNEQLKAKGKTSCVVSGARGMGRTAQGEDFVEVACADGGPGWVLDYPAGAIQPGSLLNCAQAATVGGCQLPTNVKR
jgi:hypothetical protein